MSDPEILPVAYCAPGRRPVAELALFLRGERVSEVRESRVLEGDTVIVCAPPQPLAIDPEAFRIGPSPAFRLAEMQLEQEQRDAALALFRRPLSPIVLSSLA